MHLIKIALFEPHDLTVGQDVLVKNVCSVNIKLYPRKIKKIVSPITCHVHVQGRIRKNVHAGHLKETGLEDLDQNFKPVGATKFTLSDATLTKEFHFQESDNIVMQKMIYPNHH